MLLGKPTPQVQAHFACGIRNPDKYVRWDTFIALDVATEVEARQNGIYGECARWIVTPFDNTGKSKIKRESLLTPQIIVTYEFRGKSSRHTQTNTMTIFARTESDVFTELRKLTNGTRIRILDWQYPDQFQWSGR